MNKTSFKEDLTYVLANTDFADYKNMEFPVSISKEFGERPIDDLFLETRSSNVLKRNKVHSMKDLTENWDRIHKMKNCGVTSIKEIKNHFMQVWYESLTADERVEFWEEFIEANRI